MPFIPGARVTRVNWLVGVAAVFFYLYLVVFLLRIAAWFALAKSPVIADGLGAVVIESGLWFFYAMAILPQIEATGLRFANDVIRRFQSNRLADAGIVVLLLLLMVSFLAPVIAPHNPATLVDPVHDQYLAPSWDHVMGTDRFGRDVFTRVIYGSRTSLMIGIVSVLLASLVGLVVGAVSGYAGGWVDDVVMRVVDGFLAFPRLLLVLTAVAFFARSFWVVIVLLAVTGWMGVARTVRAAVLSLKEREFVQAAVATGLGRARVIARHLVPNALGPVAIGATLRIGTIILLESYLSFLGLGVQPPTPSWGGMVFDGRDVLMSAWWVSAFPGLAIVMAVLACNLVGDGLRDALDPRIPS